MLKSLRVKNFKSMGDLHIEFPRLTVLFGANAVGKSNILDAIQALSRLATERTISDALSDPIRGNPLEAFSLPSGGLPALLDQKSSCFELDAEIEVRGTPYEYRVAVEIEPRSGALNVRDEYLATLQKRTRETKGSPRIETVGDQIAIRTRQGRPRKENLGQNHTKLSDARLGGNEFSAIRMCRNEFSAWRVYYLDPRVAMRKAQPPSEVTDIGVLGENIAPFLFRLSARDPKAFANVKRTLKALIPSVEDLRVELDVKRGTLDIFLQQNGTEFSTRIISEGTLRVLALCAIAANPWGGSLVGFEEPENGVHPRRIELIAKLLASMANNQRQVIVTSHSPTFCQAVFEECRNDKKNFALIAVSSQRGKTQTKTVDPDGPLFVSSDIEEGLSFGGDEITFEKLMLKGFFDVHDAQD